MNFETLLIEMALFCFLGLLYYLYQKKKITQYEINKNPLVMGYILQSILSERGEDQNPLLDPVIEALDDYLQNKTFTPPRALLQHLLKSGSITPELRDVIEEGLKEIDS
jgi:hypothetical protein